MSETVEANKRAAIGVGPKHKYKQWNVGYLHSQKMKYPIVLLVVRS